jgi:hypothetical protein
VTRSSLAEWFDPARIRFKISPHDDLPAYAAGDWDIERRHDLTATVKYRAITDRYAHGKRWEETDLFQDAYRRRFEAGDSVRGEPTFAALVEQYYSRVDGMFADMKRHGFRRESGPPPKLLIGRSGEVFIGNQGNHRLAMAHVLGLDKIAGEIICRHRMC